MKAAFYTRQGLADEVFQVGEQPTPEPGFGEVRVRLRTSGVNPSDWKVRKGGFNRPLMAPLIIPHSDGAGDIDAVGPGVDAGRIGERVWIWNGQWERPFGTAAQYIALPSTQAMKMPDSMDYAQGACLGIPALTAMQAVRLSGAKAGMTVLVAGGAGTVGHYAIQMAKALGATVLATVSGDTKAAHAQAAGADHVVNYRSDDFGTLVKSATGGAGVDAIIEMDLSGNAAAYPTMLRPHGKVVIYGMSRSDALLPGLWLMQNSITLQFFLVYEITLEDRLAGLAQLQQWLEQGRLIHSVAVRFPLDQVARAHDIVERGATTGKVILEMA